MPEKTTSHHEVHGALAIKTLQKRKDFLRLRKGRRFHCSSFTLQAMQSPELPSTPQCRVGYTVTKKVGKAVVRNRIKRRLRSAVHKTFPTLAQPAFDYCLVARDGAFSVDFETLTGQINVALDHVHANRAKGQSRTAPSDQVDRANSSNKPE